LDKLATELKAKNNLKLEVIAHADSRGTDSYNMYLSQKRSKVVVDYLISKGIDASRLKGIGYGETKLINSCDDENTCSEEDHSKNRRIELKLIEMK
jgi:OOP family OmpA-OmpF porin